MNSVRLFNVVLVFKVKMKYFLPKLSWHCLALSEYGFAWQTLLHVMVG